MKEKIAIVMVTVLLVGAGFLGSGMAAQRGGGHGPRGFGGPEAFGEGAKDGMGIPSQRMLRRILDLSEEQIEEVKLLKEMVKATVEPLNEERRVLREQLKAAMDTDTPDALLVGQLVIYSRNVSEDIQAVRESFADSFKTILTDEQIAKLEGPHDRRGSKGGHRRGPDGPEKDGF
jgi:Spy/CpxP family protein refolding chaperone